MQNIAHAVGSKFGCIVFIPRNLYGRYMGWKTHLISAMFMCFYPQLVILTSCEILVRRIVFKNVFVHWNLAGRLSVLINLIHPSNYEVYCSLSQHHVWHVLILFFNVQPFTLISMSFLFKHAVFMFLLCMIKCSDFLGISLPCSWFSWFLSLIEMKQKSFFKHFLTPLSLRSDPDAMQ